MGSAERVDRAALNKKGARRPYSGKQSAQYSLALIRSLKSIAQENQQLRFVHLLELAELEAKYLETNL